MVNIMCDIYNNKKTINQMDKYQYNDTRQYMKKRKKQNKNKKQIKFKLLICIKFC